MWEGRCGVYGEKVGFVPAGSCGVICGQPWGGEFGRKVPVLRAALLAAGEANRAAAQAVSALSRRGLTILRPLPGTDVSPSVGEAFLVLLRACEGMGAEGVVSGGGKKRVQKEK